MINLIYREKKPLRQCSTINHSLAWCVCVSEKERERRERELENRHFKMWSLENITEKGVTLRERELAFLEVLYIFPLKITVSWGKSFI